MTGWCFVLVGAALLLIRRIAGDAVVNGLVKIPSNKPAVHDVWNIATSLLSALAIALIAYGIVIVAAAWLAGPTRPATALRKLLAPSLRESPAVAYAAVGGVLLLVVIWGPTPAFRNIWWILVFAALLALGVTMLRRETALEFPATQHGQPLHDFQAQRAEPPDHEAASPPSTATSTPNGETEDADRRAHVHQRTRRNARATSRAARPRRDHRRRIPGREDTRDAQRRLTGRVTGNHARRQSAPTRVSSGGRSLRAASPVAVALHLRCRLRAPRLPLPKRHLPDRSMWGCRSTTTARQPSSKQ